MLSIADLKSIVILSFLSEPMMEKVLPIVDVLKFDAKEAIFHEGDLAARFFMLQHGKVLLEKRIADKITISVGSVKAGFSFGWSAMLDADAFTSDAICAEPCQVLSVRREKIRQVMDSDPEIGYILSQRLLNILKKRFDLRTLQFLRAIENHPDLHSFF